MSGRFFLMYADMPVARFSPEEHTAESSHRSSLPPLVQGHDPFSWGSIRAFCSSRMLMTSREHCKEILTSCGIDDQTDVNICVISKALSFRDNYWIKEEGSKKTWRDVNLYENPFSEDIAVTALTGESKNVHIGDDIYTGELTGRGTRAKCFIREGGNIYLVKAETEMEISAEVLSYNLTEALRLPGTRYVRTTKYGKNCSVCRIETSPSREMIPCRDYLSLYDCPMAIDTSYYDMFIQLAPYDFLKMQVFDYVTLNTDRNRDNFGVCREHGKVTGLYPVFDHDACFKGKSDGAVYFVTGKTFRESLSLIVSKYPIYIQKILPDIRRLYDYLTSREGIEDFTAVGLTDHRDETISRADHVITFCEEELY